MNSSLLKGGIFGTMANIRRQNYLHNASKAMILQRELVQRTMHQLREINEPHAQFLEPIITASKFNKNWNTNTSGLSHEEFQDLQNARKTLDNYEKIYSLFEYATDLHANMWMLETRIAANNPSNPFNIYRTSGSTSE